MLLRGLGPERRRRRGGRGLNGLFRMATAATRSGARRDSSQTSCAPKSRPTNTALSAPMSSSSASRSPITASLCTPPARRGVGLPVTAQVGRDGPIARRGDRFQLVVPHEQVCGNPWQKMTGNPSPCSATCIRMSRYPRSDASAPLLPPISRTRSYFKVVSRGRERNTQDSRRSSRSGDRSQPWHRQGHRPGAGRCGRDRLCHRTYDYARPSARHRRGHAAEIDELGGTGIRSSAITRTTPRSKSSSRRFATSTAASTCW